jgi:malate permease and related proteins
MLLINIFANNILPVLLLSGAGFALGKTLNLDARPLGRVIFYILSPVLIFNLLTSNALPIERIGLMMGFAAAGALITAGLALLIGKLFHLERGVLIIVVLTSMIVNAGNFGLPLVSFAFGQEALAYASVFFVTNSLILYTFGVMIASLGHLDLKGALLGLLKIPAIYAILLAMLFIYTGWTLPEPINRTLTLAAGGAIPGMLILLGLELQHIELSRNIRAISIPVVIRLVISPVISLGLAALFGLQIPAKQAGITEMSMPSAVMITVLATEFKLDSKLSTAIISISTILSPLTLTLVFYFLGR